MENYKEIEALPQYGTVEQKIRSIVEAMDGVNYLFNNWTQANSEIDHVDGPTIIYILPPSGEFDINYASVKDYPETQIAFLASTDFDFDGAENDNIIEHMKRLCIRFIKEVNESDLFEQIDGRLPYQVLYDHLDENVTGIVVSPRLKELQGISMCRVPRRKEDD